MDHDTRPDQITTPEALDTLPADTVMADIDPETSAVNQVVMRVLSGDWAAPGLTQMWSSADLLAGGDERWTVLFRPDAPTPTPAGDDQQRVTHAVLGGMEGLSLEEQRYLHSPNTAPGQLVVPGDNQPAPCPAGDNQREALANGWLSTMPDTYTVRVIDAEDRIVFQHTLGALRSTVAARPSAPTVTTEQRALAALTTLVALKDGPRNDTYYAERDAAWQNAREVIASRALGIEVTP